MNKNPKPPKPEETKEEGGMMGGEGGN